MQNILSEHFLQNQNTLYTIQVAKTPITKHIFSKTFSILHSLKRLRNLFPPQLKRILVQTLIMPHFDYCDIFFTHLNCDLSLKLQRAQNASLQFICNIHCFNHILPSFSKLFWLQLKDKHILHSLSLLYQVRHTSSTTTHYFLSHTTEPHLIPPLSLSIQFKFGIPCHMLLRDAKLEQSLLEH